MLTWLVDLCLCLYLSRHNSLSVTLVKQFLSITLRRDEHVADIIQQLVFIAICRVNYSPVYLCGSVGVHFNTYSSGRRLRWLPPCANSFVFRGRSLVLNSLQPSLRLINLHTEGCRHLKTYFFILAFHRLTFYRASMLESVIVEASYWNNTTRMLGLVSVST